MAGDWMHERYPLCWLPRSLRQQIANGVDHTTALGNGYMLFAEYLGYQPSNSQAIHSRTKVNDIFGGSATLALHDDFEKSGGTIQQVQQALMDMNHVASAIIPENMDRIKQEYQRQQHQSRSHQQPRQLGNYNRRRIDPSRNGDPSSQGLHSTQNTDHSSCDCMNCRQMGSQSFDRHPLFNHTQNGLLPPSYHTDSFRYSQPVHYVDDPPPNYSPPHIFSMAPPSGYSNSNSRPSQRSGAFNSNCSNCFPLTVSQNMSPQNVSHRTSQISNFEQRAEGDSLLIHGNNDPSNIDCCNCDKCRLRSDPNETMLLSPVSAPMQQCMFDNQTRNTSAVEEAGICDGISKLNISNSELSQELCSPADLHETGVKTTLVNYAECMSYRNSYHGDRRVCSKSGNGVHDLGTNVKSCSDCKRYVDKNKSSNTVQGPLSVEMLRKSWHGDSVGELTNVTKSSSDGELRKKNSATRASIPEACRSFNNEIILYSRTSLRSGGNNGLLEAEEESLQERYDNNFDSMCPVTRSNPTVLPKNIVNQSSISTNVNNSNNSSKGKSMGSQENMKKITVFVTYSWNGMKDSERHIKEIVKMCHLLRNAGIRVKVDMDPASFQSLRLNKMDWLDTETANATFIIACLSPTYYEDIQEPRVNQVVPSATQLNARYIFDKIRREYYENQCQNLRTIPVMFTNSGVNISHVPSCMASTLVYTYPEYIEKIIDRILSNTPSLHQNQYNIT